MAEGDVLRAYVLHPDLKSDRSRRTPEHGLAEAVETQALRSETVFAASALTGEGLPRLLDAISAQLDEEKTERTFNLPFSAGRHRAWLHEQGVVQSETQGEDGYSVTVRWTARQEKRYREL